MRSETVAGESSSIRTAEYRTRPLTTAIQRAVDWADRQSLGLERRGVLLFAALSILYWTLTMALASRKLMWNDELYTYYMTMLPSRRDVWAALMTGGEQTPPLFYFLTRVSGDLFGVNQLSLRLPEMLGFWVMSVCLLLFVSRSSTWYPAICAAAFPLVTMAHQYAFEARAYGLVLGFAGLALVSWQAAACGRRRMLSLVCLAASLSAAVSSHYYAVFVIVSLALGEAARSFTMRRVDAPVWAALAFPAIPLALHLPLMRAGQAYSQGFWAPPQWLNVPDFYAHLLSPAVVAVAAIVVLGVVHASFAGFDGNMPDRPAPLPQTSEVVAACGFVVIPLLAVVAAKLVTGAFADRYALSSVIGFAVLAGFAVAAAFRRSPVMRGITLACLAGWFAASQAREFVQPTGISMPVSRTTVERPAEWLRSAPGRELPLVVADPHTFTVLSHYGAPEVKQRMVYLADPDLALKNLGHNSVERGMVDLLKPWFRMNVVAFEPFVAEHPQFLLYGDFFRMAFLNWITPELQRRGMQLELLNRAGDNLLMLASRSARDAPR